MIQNGGDTPLGKTPFIYLKHENDGDRGRRGGGRRGGGRRGGGGGNSC